MLVLVLKVVGPVINVPIRGGRRLLLPPTALHVPECSLSGTVIRAKKPA